MNIARALSVKEGNGVVSCLASQSNEGTAWRGNVAACPSGAEKSRHFRHDAGDDNAWATGFVARILERSGREARGTGGEIGPIEAFPVLGDVPLVVPLIVPLVIPLVSRGIWLPFKFSDGPGLLGIGGGASGGSFLVFPLSSFAAGLGGSAGIDGGGDTCVGSTLGVDFVIFSGNRAFSFSFSCSDRLGGSGGKVEGS